VSFSGIAMFACIAFVFRYAKFYVIKVMPCHGLVLHNFMNKLHDSHVCGEGRSQDARTKRQDARIKNQEPRTKTYRLQWLKEGN